MDLISPRLPEEMAALTTDGFLCHYGDTPQVLGQAPGRVNLIGEHTDYNGGVCLPMALPHTTWAAVRKRDDDRIRLTSGLTDEMLSGRLSELAPGAVEGWAAYVAGVLWAMQEAGYDVPGVDVHIESTVPLGAGLSSSAAIECAVAVGVAALSPQGEDLSVEERRQLVRACMRAEIEMAGAPTGGMDQTIAMLAEPASALLIDFSAHTETPVPFPSDGGEFWVVDTRVSHALADTEGGYGDRRAECEAAAQALGVASLSHADSAMIAALNDPVLQSRARHVHTEIGRVAAAVAALQAGQWAELGRIFGLSHASMRDDFQISCAELDLVVETAHQAGAFGARMTGGGFGGSAVVLVAPEQAEGIMAAIDGAFAAVGWAAPGFLKALPGERAGCWPKPGSTTGRP